MSTNVIFAIPIKNATSERENEQIDVLLSLTLASLAQQTNLGYVAVVCGHSRPERALARYPDVVWLDAPFPPPRRPEEFRTDKHAKRAHIAAQMRNRAPFYFMALDADDLVHRDCVDFVVTEGENRGIYFPAGFALDFRAGALAPIPGVWRTKYYKVCGSSSFVYMDREDLPERCDDMSSRLFWGVKSHPFVLRNAAKAGRPLIPLPLPGGVYVLNNGVNISYDVIAGTNRKETLAQRIATCAVPDALGALERFVDPSLYLDARAESCFDGTA